MDNTIQIEGAKVHNLKNLDLEIPREKLVVITGLSGSGKSSHAFDTIHAEGQRRISQMQIEWKSAHVNRELDSDLLQGLERRAYRLLKANAEDWLAWLDYEDFWQPGWRGDDGEPSGDAGMN